MKTKVGFLKKNFDTQFDFLKNKVEELKKSELLKSKGTSIDKDKTENYGGKPASSS